MINPFYNKKAEIGIKKERAREAPVLFNPREKPRYSSSVPS